MLSPQTKDFPGVTGKITIDKDRNAVKPAVVLEVKDGKLEYVRNHQSLGRRDQIAEEPGSSHPQSECI